MDRMERMERLLRRGNNEESSGEGGEAVAGCGVATERRRKTQKKYKTGPTRFVTAAPRSD